MPLPTTLATACAAVLPIDGAGLSLSQQLRVPLGASSDLVSRAEKLEITIGDGPCLEAMAAVKASSVNRALMSARWLVFAAELAAQTRYQSIVSIPLGWPTQPPFGALDLYSSSPNMPGWLLGEEVRYVIAHPIVKLLMGPAVASADHDHELGWLAGRPVLDRMLVWEVTQLVMAASSMSEGDAMATLQGYAYGHNRTLDDLALHLATQLLPVDQLWQTRH